MDNDEQEWSEEYDLALQKEHAARAKPRLRRNETAMRKEAREKAEEEARTAETRDAEYIALGQGMGRAPGRKGAKDEKVAANKRAATDARAKNKKRALGKGKDISSHLGL